MPRNGIIGSRSGTASRSGWTLSAVPSVRSPEGDSVVLASDVGAIATALVADAADAVAFSLVEKMKAFESKVLKDWPVKTGYSKSRFSVPVMASGPFFVVSLENDAGYVGKIRQKGYLPESPAQRIIFDNSESLADEMARDIAEYLAE